MKHFLADVSVISALYIIRCTVFEFKVCILIEF